jgi:glycosyltransferase involved in cell wall biosynthesis
MAPKAKGKFRRSSLRNKSMKLSVIVPVYNEVHTILKIIQKVREVPLDIEILVVDDGSTDGTREVLRESGEGIKLFFHETNRGKGAAIRTAVPHLTGDLVVIQDADLEYDPFEYTRLILPIVEGKADVVYGSRFLGGPHRVLLFWHSLGNKVVTTLSNMLTNMNLTDMETGYKVFRAEVLKNIRIESDRFGFEPEITAKIAKMGCRIYEIPISYWGRDYTEGKKINWKDGIAALYWILKYNLFRKRPKR